MRKNVKRLVLNKETVRALQDSELKRVQGGDPPQGTFRVKMWTQSCVSCGPYACEERMEL